MSPTPPPTSDIRADYGTVKVEPFDPRRLAYWAARGGSHWPVDPTDLRGRISCVSRMPGVTLINTDRLPGSGRFSRNWPGDPKSLVDPYYQSVSKALLEQLKTDTAQRLSLVEAAGITAFDLSTVIQWSWGIHLFTWARSQVSSAGCWVIFHQPGLVTEHSSSEDVARRP